MKPRKNTVGITKNATGIIKIAAVGVIKIAVCIIKIAAGVVLGLFCWNLFLELSARQERNAKYERLERAARQERNAKYERLERAYEMANVECEKGDPKACARRAEISLLNSEELVERIKQYCESQQ